MGSMTKRNETKPRTAYLLLLSFLFSQVESWLAPPLSSRERCSVCRQRLRFRFRSGGVALQSSSEDSLSDSLATADPMLAEMSVLSANNGFYEAFQSVSLKKMREIWSLSDDATWYGNPRLLSITFCRFPSVYIRPFHLTKTLRCAPLSTHSSSSAHPGMSMIVGSKDIIKSWEALFSGGSMPPIRATRQRVVLRGDIAWVTCCESTGDEPAALEAINIFERKDGKWLMIHHQAAPVLPQFAQEKYK